MTGAGEFGLEFVEAVLNAILMAAGVLMGVCCIYSIYHIYERKKGANFFSHDWSIMVGAICGAVLILLTFPYLILMGPPSLIFGIVIYMLLRIPAFGMIAIFLFYRNSDKSTK